VGAPDGWYRDPSGVHALRYYRGGVPTGHVCDGNKTSYDLPPPPVLPPQRHSQEAPPVARGSMSLLAGTTSIPSLSSLGHGQHGTVDISTPRRAGFLRRLIRRSRLSLFGALVIVVALVVVFVISPFAATDASGTLIMASTQTARTGSAVVSGRITIIVRNGALPEVVTMTGPTNFSTLADFHVSRTGFESEVRYVDGVQYFAGPAGAIPGGAQWVKFTPIPPPSGIPLRDQPTRLDGISNNGVQFLAGVNSARLVGKTVMDGVPVTQYSFTTSLEKAVQADPGRIDGGLVQWLTSRSNQIDIAHMPGDVWLDDHGRVRRMSLSASGHGFSFALNSSFTQFGLAVSVAPPPETSLAPPYVELPLVFGTPFLP
jgi:hypothetical protein